MLDTTPLLDAAERFSDTLRGAPQSRLARGAAAEGLALARELARRAQLLERPGREPLTMPDAGLFAVADQVLVAATDLAEALRTGSGPVEERAAGVDAAVEAVRNAKRRAFP
ncbi:hypothetical protein ABZ714_16075 [Streptomyces sp. NPDC006798]|uniref:hypothetical protein n=1 Tax=Streptomyces sp. NPDC006798 TaxID=3155462 RepID=UPI0033F08387